MKLVRLKYESNFWINDIRKTEVSKMEINKLQEVSNFPRIFEKLSNIFGVKSFKKLSNYG